MSDIKIDLEVCLNDVAWFASLPLRSISDDFFFLHGRFTLAKMAAQKYSLDINITFK